MKKGVEKPGKEEHEAFFDKEQEQIYKIITGKIRYKPEPFRQDDLHPDLIIKMKVPGNGPGKGYVPRGKYMSLSSFITSPSHKLERVYSRAEKEITKDMEINKENVDPHNIKMRLQVSLNTVELKVKATKLINEHEEEELLELECVNQLNGLLDAFTVQYNTIIYTLQQICGFRVKSFILYDKEGEEREIYLFLNINVDNLLRVANKYRIKKEVDYTFFDFFLNDPTTKDDRPIKLHSKCKSDHQSVIQHKHLSRYFRIKEGEAKDEDVIEERDLDDNKLENFRSCSEELHILYEYIKYKQHYKLSKNEKVYVFQYNRRKINPGVEKMYSIMKKRRIYFDISKEILPKYGYTAWEEPTVFEEFSLPDKNSKGATFFNKFESVMAYKPLTVAKDGSLSLFLNMQRTKLSYMIIKQNFKVNFLSKIGVEIFTIENEFQKFGNENKNSDIRGGVDGECLVEKWNSYSLFSDMKTIRNYAGERIAYEVLYNNYIIGYMLSIIIPYAILYTLELAFTTSVYVITSSLEALLFSVSYCIFMFEWQSSEDEFVKNYCDSVESKIFLSKFRGPYNRNIITDESNEFSSSSGTGAYLKNFICFILIAVLLVVLGAIFYGFRMMILEIYTPLQDYVVGNIISVAHIISYVLFFIIEEGFRYALVGRIIQFMVYLQNPPSDEDERQWEDTLTFFYLLAIEMIPPFFLLILEPFQATSCYSNSCEDELSFYIYARYIIMLAIVLVKLAYVLIFRYITKNIKDLLRKEKVPELFYQDKLAGLLKKAMRTSKKPEHKEEKMGNVINLQNYAIYCTILPLSPAIMCLAVFIHFFSMRLSLLYEQRRPLNRSESIIRFSKQISYIYYLGIIMTSWINVFLFALVENDMQGVVMQLTSIRNEGAIFLLKFVATIIYASFLLILGSLFSGIVRAYSTDSLNARKDHKYHEYKTTRGGLKSIIRNFDEMTPLKSIFRIFNPDRTNEEILDSAIYQKIDDVDAAAQDESANIDSATNLNSRFDP